MFQYLAFGSDFCLNMGVNPRQIVAVSLLMSLFCSGIVITQFGVFAFMGLIFPHLLRLAPFFSKKVTNELLIGPVICGAVFMILDQAVYHFTYAGAEIPVGMLSSFLGAFFLLALLLKKRSV
jgi:iron complex transport system permease protein